MMQFLRKLHPNFISLNVSSYLYISVDRPVLEYHCVVLTPQLQYPCITIKQTRVNTETWPQNYSAIGDISSGMTFSYLLSFQLVPSLDQRRTRLCKTSLVKCVVIIVAYMTYYLLNVTKVYVKTASSFNAHPSSSLFCTVSSLLVY